MAVSLPKDVLKRVHLGQSFAEYDLVRDDPSIFVQTPASLAATDPESSKFIFVGRRGSGKTAIAYHISRKYPKSVRIEPMVFDVIKLPLNEENFTDTRQRPFKSLVCAFERAILGELIRSWVASKMWKFDDAPEAIRKERGLIEDCDFDLRVINLHREILEAHRSPSEKLWLRQIRRASELTQEINHTRSTAGFDLVLVIDRLDDAWDGSESAVICLMALMHACVRIASSCPSIRPFIFIRENIYRRIQSVDNEFARLETAVAFLEWTSEKLIELVARRLVRRLVAKPNLDEAWSYFFQDSATFCSREHLIQYGQGRPRHVLTYASFAIEMAVSRNHTKVLEEDILGSAERFSTSKLKDLADEFDENYHNIQLVLQLFFGLSTQYTIRAIENFVQRLLTDRRIAQHCDWVADNSTPYAFIGVLYQIGFFGVKDGSKWRYCGVAGDGIEAPQITQTSTIAVHPAFRAALHLREMLLHELSDDILLQSTGILEELPAGVTFDAYQAKLRLLLDDINTLPCGDGPPARLFETFVGDFVRFCFFRSLTNVQAKSREVNGMTIKDWVASNRATEGFWQMILRKYKASTITWECKNYVDLKAADFHQAAYYLKGLSKLLIILFRGDEIKPHYFEHVRRATSDSGGMLLIFTEKDIKTFIRQALNGKVKEDHINELHDRMERTLG